MNDILNSNTLVALKKICKFLHIKNYSGLRKNELILSINKYHAMIKLQRWARKFLSNKEPCPISFEPIKYPCYAFKTPNNVLIYYNLDALRSFLIKSGDFRDPSTRREYTDKELLEMDNIHKYYNSLHPQVESKPKKIKENIPIVNKSGKKRPKIVNSQDNQDKENNDDYFKSVFKASKSKKFYEKMKEKEQEQLIFERILDSICDDVVALINDNLFNAYTRDTLKTTYLYDYQTQFRRLLNRSKTHAEYVINKNIENLNQVNRKEKSYNNNQSDTCEYVVIFLYQLREELYII
jgi:hypothetical protein